MKMLVVDDDKTVHTKICEMVTGYNFEIEYAENGEKAISLIKTVDYDIIFIDMLMPRMHGLEVLKKCKNKMLFKKPVFILMTGCNMEGFIDELKQVEINEIIDKPFGKEELIKIFQKHLNLKIEEL